VCITGGEPLFQRDEVGDLVKLLHEREYKVEIETNGSFPSPTWSGAVDSWCVDMKCPASDMQDKNLEVWFGARPQDQIKFVVADEADLAFTGALLDKHKGAKSVILISPVLNLLTISPSGKKDYLIPGAWLQRCVEFVKERNLRLSLQIHKVIWPPNLRGV
jgi:7-carboxy-7-deazaguanine synthase